MVSWYPHDMTFLLEKRIVNSVADSDPRGSAWIRIRVKSWIRIRIKVKKGKHWLERRPEVARYRTCVRTGTYLCDDILP
jgi:hypothetical protein